MERSRTSFDLRDDYLMLQLFIGMRKLNDCRRLNVHFLKLHQMLMPGGYFVGYAHTVKTHFDWIYARFPRPMAHAVYALDFLFHRVAPKLPGVQKVYFAITKGNNRAVSRAEVLGRLCFCGFDIKATQVIDKRFYFIARNQDPVPGRKPHLWSAGGAQAVRAGGPGGAHLQVPLY